MASARRQAFSASTTSGRPLPAAGGVLLAGADDTCGLFTLIHTTVPPHDSVPLHRHVAMDESFYVIDGAISVTVGDDTHEVGAGGFVFLPRAVPHRYVAGGDGAEMLIHSTPGGLERFFDDWEAGLSLSELEAAHQIEFLDNSRATRRDSVSGHSP